MDQEEDSQVKKKKPSPKAKATAKAKAKAKADPKTKAKPGKKGSSSTMAPTETPKGVVKKGTKEAETKKEATPKAGAGAEPKAKAKGKAKAEAGKKNNKGEEQEKDENKKAPKRKASISDWSTALVKHGEEDEEQEEQKAEEEKEKSAKRDRSKSNKFNFLMAAGSVPQAVRDTFTQMTGPGSRKQKTDFLNKVMLRDSEGNLSLAGAKSATMSGSQSVSNESTFRVDDKGLTQTLFMSKFNLDEDKLKRCIMNEEVDVVTHQGQVYVSWRSLKSSSADRRRTNIELGAKKLKLGAEEAGNVQALMDGISLELPTELPDMPSKPMIGDGSPDDGQDQDRDQDQEHQQQHQKEKQTNR